MLLTCIATLVYPVVAFALAAASVADDTDSSVSNSPGYKRKCTVKALGNADEDDAPAIREAFAKCGKNGKIVFENEIYHINTVLNTTGLKDVSIDIHGELLVC